MALVEPRIPPVPPGGHPPPSHAPTAFPQAPTPDGLPRPGSSLAQLRSGPPAPRHIEPTQTPSERELVHGVMELFQRARSHRRALVSRWNENYRMLTNKHWNPAVRAEWMPYPQVPEIWGIVRPLAAWMTDQRFRHTVAPASLPHSSFYNMFNNMAKDLELVLDATWQANNEEREWGITVLDGFVYGTGIQKTCWESRLAGGMGDAMSRRVSPYFIYPDPSATSLDDAAFIIEARTMSVQELDFRYPGSASLFKQGGLTHDVDAPPNILDLLGARQSPWMGTPGALSPATHARYNHPESRGGMWSNVDLPAITVFECWLREHRYVDVTDIKTRETTRRAVESWRVVVVAGERVLMDEPAENLWSHGGHPYSRYCPFEMGEFWGFSLVELLTSPQKCINRILAAMQQNVELTGNPLWVDQKANRRGQQITNKPGQRIEINTNDSRTGWLNPPPLNQGAPAMVDFLLKRMESISGLNAILGGKSPGGRNSQGVVDSIAESSHVGIRAMLHQLEYALKEAGQRKASLIVENYNSPRIVSIAGPGGETTSRALSARHFMLPGGDGGAPLKYQLLIDAGSRHHVSKQMRESRAVQLYTLGLIDEMAALCEIDFPNYVEVAQRTMKAKQDAMMMAGGVGAGARASARA